MSEDIAQVLCFEECISYHWMHGAAKTECRQERLKLSGSAFHAHPKVALHCSHEISKARLLVKPLEF